MKINKRELISLVNEIKDKINVGIAIKDDESNDRGNGIGTSQFRDLSSSCKLCETYEELELLLRYKIAKAKNGESWKFKDRNTQNVFGSVILEQVKKIRQIYDDDTVLDALSLFFGYLYQSARVWRSEAALDRPRNDYHDNKGKKRW